MEYYVAKDGEKQGPFTQYQISTMIRDGELLPETLAWHRDLDGWKSIADIPSLQPVLRSIARKKEEERKAALESMAEASSLNQKGKSKKQGKKENQKLIPVATEVRPLVRFWARSFDYLIVVLIVMWFSDVEFSFKFTLKDLSEMLDGQPQSAEMLRYSLALWHVIEGVMIALVGTTPGKALFGIRIVTRSGSMPPILKGIIRSFLVYILGVALFYFYLLSILAMTFAFFRLMAKGSTLWDSTLQLEVKHPPLTWIRIILAIGAFITLMLMQNLNSFF